MSRREAGRARRAHDHETFQAWYLAYHSRLRGFCISWLADELAAEDVAQEALARAWARREHLGGRDQVGAWLFRVARNLCIDHLRARRRLIPVEDVPERPQDGADPHRSLEAEEERRALRVAFSGLNRRHRELLYLHHVDGLGYDELAERIGVSNQGARSVLFRARQGLRERLRAVSGGAYATLFWLRTRTRETARRAAERLEWIEPVAGTAVQAGLALAVASTMTVAGAGGAFAQTAPERTYAPGAGASAPAAAGPAAEPAEPPGAAAEESPPGPAAAPIETKTKVDPKDGKVGAGASVPGQEGGEPPVAEELVLQIDPEGDPVVRGALDAAGQVCDDTGACGAPDEE